MANETPDFLRARNATDIASQVSVPCQSFKKKKTNQKNSCDCKNTAFSFCYLTCWSDAYNGMVESVLMKGSRTFARAALICPSSSSSKNNQCFTILIISLLLLSQTLHNISHPTHSPINQTESQGLNFLSESHCLA